MAEIQNNAAISISMDGIWAGSGTLREGAIENCGAQFCDNNDESLLIYDKIEQAIAANRSELTVNIEGESHRITWTVS